MSKYRGHLPHLGHQLFLADAGMETTLIFHHGLELPHFAAFTLADSAAGRAELRRYYRPFIDAARRHGTGLLLDSASWRASRDWGARLGYSEAALAEANRRCIALLIGLRDEHESAGLPMVVSAAIGPRGDGYEPDRIMTVDEAADYHGWQIEILKSTAADLVSAYTITSVAEATGIALAARAASMPLAISFTVETDGRLPTGDTLAAAIDAVDAATNDAPLYYMVNCAHPTHFMAELERGGAWIHRVRGIRANASCRSHAELNDAADLDAGDPDELGRQYRALRERHPQIILLGGCCGTDHRHIECIAAECCPIADAA